MPIDNTVYHNIMTIDYENLKFPPVKKGVTFVGLYYNKKNLCMKLPKLRVLFDINTTYASPSVSLDLGDNTELINKIKEFDNTIVKIANEKGWLSGDEAYIPILKESKPNPKFDRVFPPSIRGKIPVRNNLPYSTDFYNNDKKPIKINHINDISSIIKRGDHVVSSLDVNGVWFRTINNVKSWGVSMNLHQIMVGSSPVTEDHCIFEDSSDDETPGHFLFEDSD